ncbi:putative defense protein 3 [Haliotis rufescens]|uniref:putative defense protein 3 n=1 Tax=Haliotis rufescens TaxID=6454 RepID=UPI00201F7CDA|nr:putative defense protein 3 [Haliotis rufescens]
MSGIQYGVYALLLKLSVTVAFPFGASHQACGHMKPVGHPGVENKSPAPYRVLVSHNTYYDGHSLNVTLMSVETDVKFRGFLLQARCRTCAYPTVPVGVFRTIRGQPPARVMNCFNTIAAITQLSKIPKERVVVTWTPPDNFDKDVHMRVTFVESRMSYWGNVISETITRNNGPPTRPQSTTTEAITTQPTTTYTRDITVYT